MQWQSCLTAFERRVCLMIFGLLDRESRRDRCLTLLCFERHGYHGPVAEAGSLNPLRRDCTVVAGNKQLALKDDYSPVVQSQNYRLVESSCSMSLCRSC